MEFLSLTRRCPSWRNVPNGEERRETAVFSSWGILVKSLVFKKASKLSTITPKMLIKILLKVTNNRISTAHYFLTPFIFYCSADSAFIQFYMRVQHRFHLLLANNLPREVTHLAMGSSICWLTPDKRSS